MKTFQKPRLGVNIDHIATLRQLRGTPYPSLLEAAKITEIAGADQITVHLREDRRHIQDQDVKVLRSHLKVKLNLEMALTDQMIRFSKKISPDWVCIVPEKRQELTTEGGLDVFKFSLKLNKAITELRRSKIKISLFVEPSLKVLRFCRELGVDAVEIHTGSYCHATQLVGPTSTRRQAKIKREIERIKKSCEFSRTNSIGTHVGHGLDYENVRALSLMEFGLDRAPLIEEYNIGHSIICRAALVGLERATREMRAAIEAP